MLKILAARFQQGYRTIPFPDSPPTPPDRLRVRFTIQKERCREKCHECIEICPTDAISRDNNLLIDLGRCLFCNRCVEVCPTGAIRFSNDFRLSVRKREDLIVGNSEIRLAPELDHEMMRVFGHSLSFRQVSAGGCNGCEVDVNVLTTVIYDLGRFGIKIVASPRHADGLIVTGPITGNMKSATLKTFSAVPAPKLVVAVGACAISGGPFREHPQQNNGVPGLLPVDLFIPGCPPHPLTILDGLLRLLGKVKS